MADAPEYHHSGNHATTLAATRKAETLPWEIYRQQFGSMARALIQ